MAVRSTEKEIQELLEQLKAKYPQARFEIEKRTYYQCASRPEVTDWLLYEVRHCARCGAEVDTVAIGEYGPMLCHECHLVEAAEAAARSEAAIAANARKVEWGMFLDSILD